MIPFLRSDFDDLLNQLSWRLLICQNLTIGIVRSWKLDWILHISMEIGNTLLLLHSEVISLDFLLYENNLSSTRKNHTTEHGIRDRKKEIAAN